MKKTENKITNAVRCLSSVVKKPMNANIAIKRPKKGITEIVNGKLFGS